MNAHVLTESLTAALNILPVEQRDEILARFTAEVLKRDERQAKLDRARKMKAQGISTREICRTLRMSMETLSRI